MTDEQGVSIQAGQQAQVALSLGNPSICRVPTVVLFDTASSFVAPLPEHKAALQAVAARLTVGNNQQLLIVGHTDDVGGSASNQQLSLRRAQAVLAVLANRPADWEAIFATERSVWDTPEFSSMLGETGQAVTPAAIAQHRENNPSGAVRRSALFAAYFQALLGSPAAMPVVTSTTPPTLGCGEQHVLASGNHRPSRRAEFFFVRSGGAVTIDCSQHPRWTNACAPLPLPPARQQEFHVAGGGDDSGGDGSRSRPWRTINHALSEISRVRSGRDAVTLHVLPGTYRENVSLPSNITLLGEGPTRPLITSTGANNGLPVLRIPSVSAVALRGLAIADGGGSGVRIEEGAASIAVEDCEVMRNSALRGGGVAIIGSRDVTVRDCQIHDNTAGTGQRAFAALDINLNRVPPEVGIEELTIRIGDGHGGGLYVQHSRNVQIMNNQIFDNTAVLFGGGIAVHNSNGEEAGAVQIENNVITCNQTAHGSLAALNAPAGACTRADMGDPVHARIRAAISDLDFAAIRLIKGVDIAAEIVGLLHGAGHESGLGGGIALRGVTAQTRLVANQIGSRERPNRARRGGGLACFVGAYPHLERNVVEGNLASADGGGIAIDQFDPFLPATRPNFLGIARSPLIPRQPIRLIDTQLLANRCQEDGGGLYATGAVQLEITATGAQVNGRPGGLVEDNLAGENGGGLRVSYASVLNARNVQFIRNQANAIGAEREGGGAVAARNSELNLTGCTFRNNRANHFAGGAVFCTSGFEGGFGAGGFIANRSGLFDEIMARDFGFTVRRYRFQDCTAEGNSATGAAGSGGFVYAVRSSATRDGNFLGGDQPMLVTIAGAATTIGANESTFDTGTGSAPRRKRGNVVIELSGRGDDRVTIFPDTTNSIANSSPPPDDRPVVIIHGNSRADDAPAVFPYFNVALRIDRVTPDFGPPSGGQQITLHGESFAPGMRVRLAQIEASSVSVQDSSTATAVTPALPLVQLAGPVDVSAEAGGRNATLAGGYTYVDEPLDVHDISPRSGGTRGGDRLIFDGSGFVPGMRVRINGIDAQSIDVQSPRRMEVVTPPGTPGSATIEVASPDGASRVLDDVFGYEDGQHTFHLVPDSGSAAGGTVVTLDTDDPSGFAQPLPAVIFGDLPAGDVRLVSAATLQMVAPPGRVGAATVRLEQTARAAGAAAGGAALAAGNAPVQAGAGVVGVFQFALGAPPQSTLLRVRNRLLTSENVAQATVEVAPSSGASVSGVTGANGQVRLNLAGLPDGNYTLRVRHSNATTDPVGPAIATATPRPARIWRPLDAAIVLAGGRVQSSTHADVSVAGGTVTINLQPVWISSPNHSARPAGTSVSMIIVHHTGGTTSQSAINTFLSQPAQVSAHYVIDTDGQVVKLVHESQIANHAGPAHWAGRDDINAISVGIEIVNAGAAYPVAQYTALLDLLRSIRTAFPTIPARNIVGHSDIATNRGPHNAANPRRLGRKSSDPGLTFEWSRLEAAGLGLEERFGPPAPGIYGGFFAQVANGRLRSGDRDAGHRYGGQARPAITANVIEELQQDLAATGYFCPVTRVFDLPTRMAVEMFQEHFFGQGRTPAANFVRGQVDLVTADRLKAVR